MYARFHLACRETQAALRRFLNGGTNLQPVFELLNRGDATSGRAMNSLWHTQKAVDLSDG